MHDLRFVRENMDLIKDMLIKRQMDPGSVDGFYELDFKRRELLKDIEELKARRNKANDEVVRLKKSGEPALEFMTSLKEVSAKIKSLEPDLAEVEEKEKNLLKNIPNLVHPSVPIGPESAQVEERKVGGNPTFAFPALHHYELGEKLGLLDFPRAAKIAGARFAVLFGELAKLNRAIISFMLDLHTKKHGYKECWPPALVNSGALYGTGQLPKFAEDLFKVEGRDLWLIPTAEVPVTNLFRDETLEASSLPISLCAYTPCFRSEAGAAGKDTRGLIRMHQFDKVELVKFTYPDDSMYELEKLTADAQDVLAELELPYRVISLASGDLGFSSTKTYDLEVWLPIDQVYREISSCSSFTDFQARRANIRYKEKGKSSFLHTLNGSGLAVGRTLAAILENYQEEDGSVKIPRVLVPYMDGTEKILPQVKRN